MTEGGGGTAQAHVWAATYHHGTGALQAAPCTGPEEGREPPSGQRPAEGTVGHDKGLAVDPAGNGEA